MEAEFQEQSAVIYNQQNCNLNQYVVDANYYGDPTSKKNHFEEIPEPERNELSDDDMIMIEEEIDPYNEVVKQNQATKGKITKEDFNMLKVIGQGSYGKVFLVQHKKTGISYAMKMLKKADLKKRNQVEHTMAERRILEKIKHPFIVSLQYSFQSKKKLYFVMDYCPGGELFFYLQNIGKFKEKTACFYASNILFSIEELHKNDIIYRDLKPENVLIGTDGYAKITDFGLSKENIQGNSEAHSF